MAYARSILVLSTDFKDKTYNLSLSSSCNISLPEYEIKIFDRVVVKNIKKNKSSRTPLNTKLNFITSKLALNKNINKINTK